MGARLADLDQAAYEWYGLVYYRLLGYTDALFPGPGSLDDEPMTARARWSRSSWRCSRRRCLLAPPSRRPRSCSAPRPPRHRRDDAAVIGSYAKGCLAGGTALPIDGPAWQAMRLSRNRVWGHPELIAFIERLAIGARADGWPGLLVGDMAQPRGGPMRTGHASHQIGLDVDLWLTPMPDRRLTGEERETISAVSMLARHADRRPRHGSPMPTSR